MNPAAVTYLPSPRPSARSAPHARLPLSAQVSIGLLVLWTVSQVVAMIPTLPVEARKLLMALKVLIGPMTFALVAIVVRPSLRIPYPTRAFIFFAGLSVFNLTVRSEPNWTRAALCIAWGSCFVIIPGVLDSIHRLRVFVLWSVRGILVSVAFAIVMAVIDGEHVIDHRGRYIFGMGGNYFAMLVGNLTLAGVATRALEPDRNALFGRSAFVIGLTLVVLANCRTQNVMLVLAILVYGAATSRGILGRLCSVVLGVGLTAALTTTLLVGTAILPFETVNEYSSGRMEVWRVGAEANLSSDDLGTWLWGNGVARFDYSKMRKGWHIKDDPLTRASRATALFRRRSIDNAYLDIIFTTGLIGLFAGLYAWLRWWRSEPFTSKPS